MKTKNWLFLFFSLEASSIFLLLSLQMNGSECIVFDSECLIALPATSARSVYETLALSSISTSIVWAKRWKKKCKILFRCLLFILILSFCFCLSSCIRSRRTEVWSFLAKKWSTRELFGFEGRILFGCDAGEKKERHGGVFSSLVRAREVRGKGRFQKREKARD